MAANESNMINFWDYFHDQAEGKDPGRRYHSYNGSYPHRRGKLHDTSDRILPAKDGAYKTYSGSDNVSPDNHSGSGKFVTVPTNDLNVMDYADYKGIPFILENNNINKVEYQLGTANREGVPSQKNGNTPYSSIHVVLRPQRAKHRDGKPINHKDGSPIYTTGRGGWIRFSQPAMKWKGNSLIRFIKDINNTNSDRFAYRELANMASDYGTETKFDPLDKNMDLPESSQGGDYTRTMGHRSMVQNKSSHQNVHEQDVNNPYEQASSFAQHILTSTMIGNKALKYLHGNGISDDYIKNNYMGYIPAQDTKKHPYNIFSQIYKNNKTLQLGIKSRLVSRDKDGNFQDRLRGYFIQPNIKNGKIVGVNGYDKNGQRVQALKNENVARHPGKYALNPLRNDYNDKNPKFTDPGHNHDSHDKQMAMLYLHQKRGLRKMTVNRLMNDGMIRTSPGIKKNINAENDILKTRSRISYLKANQDRLINDPNYGSKKYHEEMFSNNNHLGNHHLQNAARGFPAYIEFPQKLPRNDKHLHAEDQETVGADRIQFDPNQDGFIPSDAKLDKDGNNIGGRGKRVVANGMKNYGYNITCGADKASKQRKLFVFESPLDALSYIDIHSRYINSSKVPCDFLSLSGSGSKTKSVSNYINHRLKGTDQHYNQIVFGTDNDKAGQQFITDYTRAARKYMPKTDVDHLFHVAVPPFGKDWNDTMQATQKRGYHYQFQDNKVNYSMDDFKDKVVRDNTKHMSREGLADAYQINGFAKKAYNEFENKGENPGVSVKPSYIQNIRNAYKRMNNRDPKDAKIYHEFTHGIGHTLSPVEIDRSFHNILTNSQNLGRKEDDQMAFADHEKKYRMKNQNHSDLSFNQTKGNDNHFQNQKGNQKTATHSQKTIPKNQNEQPKQSQSHNKETTSASIVPKGMSGREWINRFKKNVHDQQVQKHRDAKKFNQRFDQKQESLNNKKRQEAKQRQYLARKQQNHGPSFH